MAEPSAMPTYKSSEDEENTDNDPGLDGGETLGLGDVGGDGVEDVHQHQEHRDQQGHSKYKINTCILYLK